MIYLDEYKSPVGTLSIASDGEHICGLWLDGQKYYQDKLAERVGSNEDACISGEDARAQAPVLLQAREWLDTYFTGHDPGELPPLALHGTQFQEQVWQQLTEIPFGVLTTYGSIAKALEQERGGRVSARAVGVAVGRNPVSIIVPCHRVIGAGKSLTGYAGGIERKIKLLELEGIDTSSLIIPTKGTAL